MSLVVLPNVRRLFIPDPGFTIMEGDLSGADAQVVAWEAEDEDLKAAFCARLDIHDKNAEDMWGAAYTKLPGTKKEGPRSVKRQETKKAVHATNYGAAARTVAIALGWTVHDAEQFQKRWFGLHPGVRDNFHRKVEESLGTNRTIRNRFGYHRIFFDRIESSFAEALAWIPQSTVAITTLEGALQLQNKFEWVQFLLQVHDSLVFQIPTPQVQKAKEIKEALEVTIPYDDPLIIPWSLTASEKSWGEAKELKFV